MNERRLKPLRVYADTSVHGGAFDDEFALSSRIFFRQVEQGKFRLVIAPLVELELRTEPMNVRTLFTSMLSIAETAQESELAVRLMDAYLRADIVGSAARSDALHVATATVAECRVIVSWNFKHIVHYDKIPLYNAVNRTAGYAEIAIHTPQEVVRYEEKGFRLR